MQTRSEGAGPERHALANQWPLPYHLRVDGRSLSYAFGPLEKVAKRGDSFFSDFLQIADSSTDTLPQLVAEYATRHGVLELCERHGLPSTHPNWRNARHPATEPPEEYLGRCPPRRDGNGFSEPLSEWRYWSRQALALVRVAACARREELGSEEDFQFLLPVPPREAREIRVELQGPAKRRRSMARIAAILGDSWPQSAHEQWKLVIRTLNYWLSLGRAQPWCTLEDSQPAVIMAPSHESGGWLFTMLSIQLLVAISGAKALECCTNCRKFYLPKKVASTGTRRFCPQCGTRAARRLAQADYRKRRGDTPMNSTI
jgi:hypothetical protein